MGGKLAKTGGNPAREGCGRVGCRETFKNAAGKWTKAITGGLDHKLGGKKVNDRGIDRYIYG